jgi:hypothetical protein
MLLIDTRRSTVDKGLSRHSIRKMIRDEILNLPVRRPETLR